MGSRAAFAVDFRNAATHLSHMIITSTQKTRRTFTGAQIQEALRKAGVLESGETLSVEVPRGGDYSGMELELDAELSFVAHGSLTTYQETDE